MEVWVQILVAIGVIVTQIVGFFTTYVKSKNANNTNDKNFKLLFSKVDTIEAKVTNVEELHSVESKLVSAINTVASKVIKYNEEAIGGTNVEVIINTTKENIKKVALELYNSEYRNKPGTDEPIVDIISYLHEEADNIKKRVRHTALKYFPKTKKIEVFGKEIDMDYDQFAYHITDLEFHIKTFIEVLIKNGLSSEEYIDKFRDFSENIFLCQTKSYKKWTQLL